MITIPKEAKGAYRNFCLRRRSDAYSWSLFGHKTPAELQKPPTNRERIALIRKYANSMRLEDQKLAFELWKITNYDGSERNESRSCISESHDSNLR